MKNVIIGTVLCLSLMMIAGCNKSNTEVTGQGSTDFMSYGGAVFPLSLMTANEGIAATRNIAFDFSYFGETGDEMPQMLHNDIRVADSYRLTNETTEDKTVTVIYPFASRFGDLERLLPSITLGGTEIDTALWVGGIMEIQTWRDYEAYLSGGSYFGQAITAVPELNRRVIVYEFTNAITDNREAIAPTLAASFNMDFERTDVLTYGFNGTVFDPENSFMRKSFFLPHEPERSHFLIILGDDISDFSLQGYGNGALSIGDEIDVTVDVRRFEAVLGDIWDELIYDFTGGFATDDWNSPHETMKTDLFRNASAALLHDAQESDSVTRQIFSGSGLIEDLFSHTLWANRLFYLSADVVIPAGESIVVNIDMIRPGSFDFHPARRGNEGLNGYDMFIALGTNLVFGDVTAEIIGTDYIEVIRTNLGFSPDNSIFKVNLDIEVPIFYLEVRGV